MSQSSKPTRQSPIESVGLPADKSGTGDSRFENNAHILVVSPNKRVRERFGEHLGHSDNIVHLANDAQQVHDLMARRVVDLLVVDRDLEGSSAFDLCAEYATSSPGAVVIFLADDPTCEDAIRAMRAGAVDLINSDIEESDLFEHVSSALDRVRYLRKQERRALRLRGLCLRLNAARQEVSQHVGELCSDLVEAYQDLSGQIEHIGIASELHTLLRQELDLECLLRTSLEYLLGKVGSTNAAIFLPSSTGEFSLGAYVNYDRSKEEAEIMLDHLSSILAPRFESATGVSWLKTPDDFANCLEDESHWLDNSQALIVPCRDSGECLAVLVAFRDQRTPFVPEDQYTIEVLGELFGRQLARVINVHHRCSNKNLWGLDEDDLAA